MSYDFHGGWERKTGHNSPLFTSSKETNTANMNTVSYLIQQEMPKCVL